VSSDQAARVQVNILGLRNGNADALFALGGIPRVDALPSRGHPAVVVRHGC
jgi:hypothetical protein